MMNDKIFNEIHFFNNLSLIFYFNFCSIPFRVIKISKLADNLGTYVFIKPSSLNALSFVQNGLCGLCKSRYDLAKNAFSENIKSNLITFKKLLSYNLSDPDIMKPQQAKLSLIHLIKIEIQNKKNDMQQKAIIKKQRISNSNKIKAKIVLSLKFLSIYIFLFIYSSPSQPKINAQKTLMEERPVPIKQKSHRRVSNPMDKICSKLQISLKDATNATTLSKSTKLKIQKLIEQDEIKTLQNYLNKNALSYEVQIGIKSMKWNIVHFAAKNNSQKILKVILAKTYQQSAQKYNELINSQTSQGYTPLMVSIINFAHQAFSLLLEMGGTDTQLVDRKRMTAYDLALNYKNESAIRELMSYESTKKKRGNFVNQQLLLKPIDPQLYSEGNCYTKMFDCFVDCFLCFKYGQDDVLAQVGSDEDGQMGQQSFLRKSFNNNKLMSLLKYSDESQIDIVPIGNKEIEAKYSIEWKRLSTAVNQKTVLFDCFQPFDICENNLIIANNLIIFQCLSDHTWLVRKLIRQLKKGESLNLSNMKSSNSVDLPLQYAIQIYINDELKKITVDEHIPFLKQRQQPMFLSNANETWPQILQKALAKLYGSYMKLSEIAPMVFVENLTGSYTKSFALEDGVNYLKHQHGQFIKDKSLMSVLQEFIAKGYVILLEGRQGTTLSPKNSPSSFRNYCYTVLNFYEKGTKKLILVNCPYVLNSWKQKEKNEIMQLKLIKSHYNSHNQMCVWIEESQFAHFFKNIIISFTEPNMIRTQMKMRYLLETETQTKDQNKFMAAIESIANSAKNIFSSSKNCQQKQKKESTISNPKKGQSHQGSSISFALQVQKHRLIRKLVFVKFNIENSKNTESFSLAIKDNSTHLACKIDSFKGWIDGGSKDITLDEVNPFCTDLIKIKQKKGEYLCMFEVQFAYVPNISESSSVQDFSKTDASKLNSDKENGVTENRLKNIEIKKQPKRTSIDMVKTIKKHQLLVICWSEDNVHLQHIEEEFAMIDCLQSWRKNTIKNWSFIDKKQNGPNGDISLKYLIETIGNKMIVMTKSLKDITVGFRLESDPDMQSAVMQIVQQGQIISLKEGKRMEQTSQAELIVEIEMVSDSQHNEFKYIVLGRKEELSSQLDSLVCNFFIKK